MNSTRFSRRSGDCAGAALLIVLSLVVLLTALVAAYLSWAISQRQVANSSGNQTKSELFARGALDVITSSLQQEIVNGSTATTVGGTTIYTPTATANIMPVRITSVGGTYERKSMPSLLRESLRTDPAASPAVPSLASACNSTTDVSVNGRKVSLARWNAHCLLAGPGLGVGSTGTGDRTPYSTVTTANGNPNSPQTGTFAPPDWVFVLKNSGPEVITAPDSAVIGRYAYVMYDEAGLLDVNAAGFPELTTFTNATTTFPQQIGLKGSLAFADLTQLTPLLATTPFMPQLAINQIVGLRNYGTMTTSTSPTMPTGSFPSFAFTGGTVTTAPFLANYATNVITNVNGFMRANSVAATSGQTDQAILSRQELINLVAATGTANCAYLPYLGTFSRAVNAPSWSPPLNASAFVGGTAISGVTWAGSNGTPAIYAYKDNAEISSGSPFSTTSPNPNRNLANVRFPAAGTVIHYDDNGNPIPYAVNAGDPLLQRRFSLAKLAWVTFEGPSAAVYAANANDLVIQSLENAGVSVAAIQGGTAANIQACFGLQWNNKSTASGQPYYRWEYVGPTGTTTQSYIETLSQVGNAPASNPTDSSPREPNFFELLKAGILSGSLGRDPGPGIDTSTATTGTGLIGVYGGFGFTGGNYKSPTDLQIMQIGVNIIDQTSPVTFPTAIHLEYWSTASTEDELAINTVYGDKNLPAILNVGGITLADPVPTGGPAPSVVPGKILGWFELYLWNIHQLPTSARPGGDASGNLDLRAHAYGVADTSWDLGSPDPSPAGKTYWDDGTGNDASGGKGDIYFIDPATAANSPFYSSPRALDLVTTTGATGTGGSVIVQMAPTAATAPAGTTPWMNSYNLDPTTFNADDVANGAASHNQFVGFSVGPDSYTADPTKVNGNLHMSVVPDTTTPAYFSLQYKGPDGYYHPYTFWSRVAQTDKGGKEFSSHDPSGFKLNGSTSSAGYQPAKADPRTDRFSASDMSAQGQAWNNTSTMSTGNGIYFSTGVGAGYGDFSVPYISSAGPFIYYGLNSSSVLSYYDPNLTVAVSGPTTPGLWLRNDPSYASAGGSSKITYYADPDGVVRYGDGYRQQLSPAFTQTAASWSGDGSQLYLGTAAVSPTSTITAPASTASPPGSAQARRPVILNRPFRSVGELGFAYRDDPFKTLDFWSQYSGDAALLDLFSVNDQPTVIAGQINPYSAANFVLPFAPSTSPVLQALLSGTVKSDSLGVIINANTTSPTDLTTLGKALAADLISNGPYTNRSQLATRMGPLVSDPHNGAPAFSTAAGATATWNWANKAYAEAPMRALVDVTNTRTWNVMIDVVAQTGKFAPGATGLANFIVQGETHYWLHIAIDRFTGKVVDQKLEPVYE